MPIAAALPYIATAISVGSTVKGAIDQKKAAKQAEEATLEASTYNAAVDRADAAQIDTNTRANIDAMRRDAASYMSRQVAAYAGSGVMSNSGSPLVARVTTAGRFAMQENQAWRDSLAKQERLYAGAEEGIREGADQADMYHAQGNAAILNGSAKLAGQLYDAYQGGVFGGSKLDTELAGAT